MVELDKQKPQLNKTDARLQNPDASKGEFTAHTMTDTAAKTGHFTAGITKDKGKIYDQDIGRAMPKGGSTSAHPNLSSD